jgi:activating signal cointegrator complex subunit 3
MYWLFYLQLYISRGSIDSFSLVSDAAYISASLARIMRALFEICLRRGWCEISLLMLEYCKAVDRQIWPHQHPLRQFGKDISAEVCLINLYYLLKLNFCCLFY